MFRPKSRLEQLVKEAANTSPRKADLPRAGGKRAKKASGKVEPPVLLKGKNMRNSLHGKPVLLKQKKNKERGPGTATATITLYELMMDLFVEPKRPPARETRTGQQRSRANA
jgi:hypothetical protein